jgi:hypothetical protein
MTGSNIKRFKNPLIYTAARTFADVTREPANYRLWRFSLRLNLHKVPQSKRNHIVEYLGLALEMCQGSRLDEIIAACERFIEHDDWKVLLNDLKTLTTAVQNVLQ